MKKRKNKKFKPLKVPHSAYYANNLKARMSFSSFFKKYWIFLTIVMLFLPIVIVIVAICEKDIKVFDVCAVVLTYIGATLLSLIVYYYSWSQGIRQDNLKRIRVKAETEPNYFNKNLFVYYTEKEVRENYSKLKVAELSGKDVYYTHIKLTNMSHSSPMLVEFIGCYYKTKTGNVEKFSKSYHAETFLREYLEFGQTKSFFVGKDMDIFNESILKQPQTMWSYAVFKLMNLDEHKAYLIHVDRVSEGCDNSSVFLLADEEYEKLVKKYGYKILNRVGWGMNAK